MRNRLVGVLFAMALAVLGVVGTVGAVELLSVTVANEDLVGNELTGRVRVEVDGVTMQGLSPRTWTVGTGSTLRFAGKWGGLDGLLSPETQIQGDTTYVLDALTGAWSSYASPGECRVEVIFEPISVFVANQDPLGADLGGGTRIQAEAHGGGVPSIVMANGGSARFFGRWGGLLAEYTSFLPILKGTTTQRNARTDSITVVSTPGLTLCATVFEPVDLVVVNVDEAGEFLGETVGLRGDGFTWFNVSSHAWTLAAGAPVEWMGNWGGLASAWSPDITLAPDTTYCLDAATGVLSAASSPGESRAEVSFTSIPVLLQNVDQYGNTLDGKVRMQYEGRVWEVGGWSPETSPAAKGGSVRFRGIWEGIDSGPSPYVLLDPDTTYVWNTINGIFSQRSTPGHAGAEIIFFVNYPPTADAGVDRVVEANTFGGSIVTLDGLGSTDDGELLPLTYEWTWDGGSASGVAPEVFLPLGETAITLTVFDGEHSDSDTVLILVQDTTPPEIAVSVSPCEIWPPNHKMIPIEATVVVTDIADPSPTVVLLSIVSNEPEDVHGTGDGTTEGDIQEAELGTLDCEFFLRAERAAVAEGRIYTVTYLAIDASGNSAVATATVVVPHDVGAKNRNRND